MTAYYNENDPEMAVWLRELISRGLLPDGPVDERSITEVTPDDLRPFTQCHFFAGIGGWPAALKWLIGWPDDRPVWTGSCPCQPFSGAGKGKGFDDERHLWPAFFHLIRVCNPVTVYGEQVTNVPQWIDLVQDDLEGEDFTFGTCDLAASSVGAPHIRQRNFWSAHSGDYLRSRVAYSDCARQQSSARGWQDDGQARDDAGRSIEAPELADATSEGLQSGTGYSYPRPSQFGWSVLADCGVFDRMGDTYSERPQGYSWDDSREGWKSSLGPTTPTSVFEKLADAYRPIPQLVERERARPDKTKSAGTHGQLDGCGELCVGLIGTDAVHGQWGAADWLFGRDGKFRPVETGSFPLADGISERVVRLRGYGNAIVPQVAAAYIQADQEGLNDVYPTY